MTGDRHDDEGADRHQRVEHDAPQRHCASRRLPAESEDAGDQAPSNAWIGPRTK